MFRAFCLLCAVCLLLSSAVAVRADDAIELRWGFKKGQVHKYRLKHREERTVAVGTEKLETTTDSDYEWQWKVQEVDEKGTATLEHQFTAMKVRHSGKELELDYDSSRASDTNDDYKKKAYSLFDQLRIGTYRVKLAADGRVAEVYGLDKVITETAPGSNVADFHAVHLHDGSFAWVLQRALGELPGKAVPLGGKWKTTAPASLSEFGNLSGEMETALGKTVKVGDDPCHELKASGSHTLDLDMKWANMPLRGPLKTSKLTSTVLFDAKAGVVRKGEADVELAGDLKLGGGDNPIELKVSYKHRFELERKP